jgi:malonate transporter and related proteins
MMTSILLDALVPIFVGLLIGFIAGRLGVIDNVNVRSLIALVMDFAIPCALFSTISEASWEVLDKQASTAFVIALVFCISYAACYWWAIKSLKISASDAAVLALTVGFPNSAAVALPLLDTAYGAESTVSAALSIVVGSITISPLTVAILEADKGSNGQPLSVSKILRFLPRGFAKPVVWVPALALVWVYFGLHQPVYLQRTLTTIGSAATGSALILTGVVVSAHEFRFDRTVFWTTTAILLFQPVLALGTTLLFHMSPDQVRDITIISAIPGGFFGLVFGKSFNALPDAASSGVIASYVGGAITLAAWMLIVAKYF